MPQESSAIRPVGYAYLIEKYELAVLPNWHTSFVGSHGVLRTSIQNGQEEAIYPKAYWPGEEMGAHLEFAIKYDGVNLGILSALFEVIEADEITAWIRSKPTGKYVRKIWFLYEFLTDAMLPLPDLSRGNYVEVLESDRYYTVDTGQRIPRQRVIDNLLGTPSFCPIVRRTNKLIEMEELDLRKRCEKVLTQYPAEVLKRALNYLYTKETKSSFEIEHITPNNKRIERFIALLSAAEHKDFCEKPFLLELQNRIVDERFADKDYRSSQNYVGQTIRLKQEIIYYICPKPDAIHKLMDGLLCAHQVMKASSVSAIIHASVISYGFVFLHPFEDGNGRIHRFLIHNILSLRGFVPRGLMFPVSAAMLKNQALYDASLKAFSKPLMGLMDYSGVLEYRIDDNGQMTVQGDTARLYKYMDMTAQAEALFNFALRTIEDELVAEIEFLASYDKTKRALQEIVDMPDKLTNLFIKLCLENNGHLSANKRESHFPSLTDEELATMEAAVREGYATDNG